MCPFYCRGRNERGTFDEMRGENERGGERVQAPRAAAHPARARARCNNTQQLLVTHTTITPLVNPHYVLRIQPNMQFWGMIFYYYSLSFLHYDFHLSYCLYVFVFF
jgi:hypothetical protein